MRALGIRVRALLFSSLYGCGRYYFVILYGRRPYDILIVSAWVQCGLGHFPPILKITLQTCDAKMRVGRSDSFDASRYTFIRGFYQKVYLDAPNFLNLPTRVSASHIGCEIASVLKRFLVLERVVFSTPPFPLGNMRSFCIGNSQLSMVFNLIT